MTSRLKRKLDNVGIDASSTKATESFCLARAFKLARSVVSDSHHIVDRHTFTASRKVEGPE